MGSQSHMFCCNAPQKSGAKIQAKMGLVLVEIIYYTEKKTNFAVSNIAGQMSPIQLPTHTDGLTKPAYFQG